MLLLEGGGLAVPLGQRSRQGVTASCPSPARRARWPPWVFQALSCSGGWGGGSANTSLPQPWGEGSLCSFREGAPTSGTLQQGSHGLAGWDDHYTLKWWPSPSVARELRALAHPAPEGPASKGAPPMAGRREEGPPWWHPRAANPKEFLPATLRPAIPGMGGGPPAVPGGESAAAGGGAGLCLLLGCSPPPQLPLSSLY